MKKQDLVKILKENKYSFLDGVEEVCNIHPIDNKIEDYVWNGHFSIGTKTYQLEDGLVKIRGGISISFNQNWEDYDVYCQIV